MATTPFNQASIDKQMEADSVRTAAAGTTKSGSMGPSLKSPQAAVGTVDGPPMLSVSKREASIRQLANLFRRTVQRVVVALDVANQFRTIRDHTSANHPIRKSDFKKIKKLGEGE